MGLIVLMAMSPVRARWPRSDADLVELGLSPTDVAVQLGHTDGEAPVMSTYGHPSERARILTALNGHDQGDLAPLRCRAVVSSRA